MTTARRPRSKAGAWRSRAYTLSRTLHLYLSLLAFLTPYLVPLVGGQKNWVYGCVTMILVVLAYQWWYYPPRKWRG